MKSIIIIVPLLFLCVFAKAHKKNLVDRVYPLIENVDTINANCRIIKKYKPQKQIAKLLSVVDNTQDTILIIADKSECDIFKIGKTYALSLAEVRQFTYTIIRNGVIMQVFFDRGTKHCTYIPYVNKVKPLLFILLRYNGSDTFRERKVDSNGNCFGDNSVKFVDNSHLPMPVTENACKLQWQNKCYYGMLHGPSAIAASVQPCKYAGKVGAHGPMGVILQPETEKADILLSANAFLVMKQNNFNVFSSKVRWAMAVYALFSNVGTLKYIQNVTK